MRFYREEVFDLHHSCKDFLSRPKGNGSESHLVEYSQVNLNHKTHTHTHNQSESEPIFSTKVLLTCLDCQQSIDVKIATSKRIRGLHWLTIKSKTPAYILLNPLTSPYKHRRYKIRNGYPKIEDKYF